MHSTTYLTLDRDVRQLRQSEFDAFKARISGGVLGANDAAYDDARKVWNATVDRRPALIARCLTEATCRSPFASPRAPDAAQRARRRPPYRRQRGGRGRPDARHVGHAEHPHRCRRKDRAGRPGALLADLDREAQAHGLATPLGINSTTGVAGLTLAAASAG
jgi:hypothetical protein